MWLQYHSRSSTSLLAFSLPLHRFLYVRIARVRVRLRLLLRSVDHGSDRIGEKHLMSEEDLVSFPQSLHRGVGVEFELDIREHRQVDLSVLHVHNHFSVEREIVLCDFILLLLCKLPGTHPEWSSVHEYLVVLRLLSSTQKLPLAILGSRSRSALLLLVLAKIREDLIRIFASNLSLFYLRFLALICLITSLSWWTGRINEIVGTDGSIHSGEGVLALAQLHRLRVLLESILLTLLHSLHEFVQRTLLKMARDEVGELLSRIGQTVGGTTDLMRAGQRGILHAMAHRRAFFLHSSLFPLHFALLSNRLLSLLYFTRECLVRIDLSRLLLSLNTVGLRYKRG
ncbi:hypothetical protein PENTCL1PPCAC_1549 [Pristionchus entomophagus]|uniref:G protein-coupled receptor n=1 Tax=Pristionchus entomophagus TaxID=358040 RepID=A0AAV5SH55_9BILA|nr:hypothetical protein PENTCL1PPCAC_1549 [Pristionchus entomophagus]